ncbi:hypothetical protein ADL32_29535 [Streptomyces albidoflavus]|nr:hypothetical protein ADL32_29535 [Streptomyces albidoflavus]
MAEITQRDASWSFEYVRIRSRLRQESAKLGANMSYWANLSASCGMDSWYARTLSAAVRQKVSSSRTPSPARVALRKRR